MRSDYFYGNINTMRDIKYACLFGGGAIRGAAHVGVVKALKELGVEPTILAGSSVGSIVAALLAVGYSCEELSEVFLSVNFELFRDISFGFKQKFALSKGEVFLDWIRKLIEDKYYGENEHTKPVTFKDLDKNLVIIATKMNKFECCEFSNFVTPDFEVAMAVRISCCMPGLMRAVHLGEDMLVDGDLLKGKPMWSLCNSLKNVSDRILEVRLEGTFSGSDSNPIEYVNGMYSCITCCETDFIKETFGQKDKYDYLVIDTGNVVVVDFNYPQDKRQEIIDSGYAQTITYFKKNLLAKKENLSGIYSQILDKIRDLQGLFLAKKYTQMKSNTSELFIYLADAKDFIDEEIYNSICNFQKNVFSNIKYGLFGYVGCKNREELRNSLNSVISILTERIAEINDYLKAFE